MCWQLGLETEEQEGELERVAKATNAEFRSLDFSLQITVRWIQELFLHTGVI